MKFPNIHWALSHQRMTQYQLAATIGWGESKLSRALSGRAEFTPEECTKIAEILEFPMDWLFAEVTPPPEDRKAGSLGGVVARV